MPPAPVPPGDPGSESLSPQLTEALRHFQEVLRRLPPLLRQATQTLKASEAACQHTLAEITEVSQKLRLDDPSLLPPPNAPPPAGPEARA